MDLGRIALLLFLVGVAAAATLQTAENDKVVVCYYGTWAVYRQGAGKFDVEDIDPFICTHAIYGFAGLSEYKGVMISLDPWNDLYDDYGLGAFTRFCKLKEKNPKLKTLLAIGGWNEGSPKYSKMVSTPQSRKTFLVNAVDFLKKYGFDGLDFDWEYPTQRGGDDSDRENFATFLSEMRELFDQHGLMMTAAVSAGKQTIDPAYDIPAMGKYLDHIHVMCYDYHGSWDPVTGHNAPLYQHPMDYGDYVYFNVNFTMHYWMQKGAPANKLVLGMGLYGRSFTLSNNKENGLYAPSNQPGNAGAYTEEPGYLGYNELCDQMKTNPSKWTIVNDKYIMAPYTYKGNQWIGYDDPASIKLKAQFAAQLGLKGAMVWSIETDDFHGGCHGVKFPLLRAIWEGLNGGEVPTPPPAPSTISPPSGMPTDQTRPTMPPATTTTSRPTPPPTEICKKAGMNPDPNDCTIFYLCTTDTFGKWQMTQFKCGAGTVFDPVSGDCTWPSAVPGCEDSGRRKTLWNNH
ncbi:chitinase-3-like protein 1 [Ischnura elegans]|uniref:chitinase-3-like protein 1 n=1 Tax=Ischnura elegans TaxID=197161 RepID=UPI001ED8BFFD|nr:chitinase-3-like protein 1 [Ischnura elegans]